MFGKAVGTASSSPANRSLVEIITTTGITTVLIQTALSLSCSQTCFIKCAWVGRKTCLTDGGPTLLVLACNAAGEQALRIPLDSARLSRSTLNVMRTAVALPRLTRFVCSTPMEKCGSKLEVEVSRIQSGDSCMEIIGVAVVRGLRSNSWSQSQRCDWLVFRVLVRHTSLIDLPCKARPMYESGICHQELFLTSRYKSDLAF